MTSISAALIVRNEEKFLDDCLHSLHPLVDEIVVVDTGSQDRTMEIAREHSVRLFEFTWNERFDDARNYGLEQCKSDWVLYIDADERIRITDFTALRQQLAPTDVSAAQVQFYVKKGFTPYLEWRLFRNTPDIRFHGAIHETIVGDINTQVSKGYRTIIVPLVIDHLGYEGDLTHKHKRNLPILLKALKESPSRIYLWSELGRTQMALGNHTAAINTWQEGLSRANTNVKQIGLEAIYSDLIQYTLKQDENATDLLNDALTHFPDSPIIQWLHGWHLARQHQHQAACQIFSQLMTHNSQHSTAQTDAYSQNIFGVDSLEPLAHSLFELKRYHESAECYQRASKLAPERLDLQVKASVAAGHATQNPPPT